ncbi:MAG TPA: GTPase HflX [Firmicutes bacterium]|mgnify:FL=1|nr:GTPase HflX [Bacillota bacterium]
MEEERMDTERGARAVLVALNDGGLTERALSASLNELSRLLDTAGGSEAARVVQNAPSADPKTYIGSGKAKEIAEFVRNDGNIDLVVFDNELSPSQIRNLEDILDVRVIDRTMLILDIFALHAVTGEGKLQVEIACLRYSAPRLTGKGKSLSRQGGTSGPIGSRGPGESKLELDRRRIRERISALNAELKNIEKTRAVNRSQRIRAGIPTAAIVGYTNAGKSTLLNRLTDAGILAEDKLFATLDPTTRRLTLPRGGEMLLTDTVGFIDRLPTHLIKAFKSTLEEAVFADIIIHLVDAGEPAEERTRKYGVTLRLLEELGISGKPMLEVYNKMDAAVDTDFIPSAAVCISAADGTGIDRLLDALEQTAENGNHTVKLFIPHREAGAVSELFERARVIERAYTDEGICLTVCCDEKTIGRYKQFIVNAFGK